MPSLKEAASKAASKARNYVHTSFHDTYPWLFIRNCEDVADEVLSAWLQDSANLDIVSKRTGMRFKEDPLNNVDEKHAIVWTQKWGKVEQPYPGRHLVILALDDLREDNGLPLSKDENGNAVKNLNCGEFIVFSGDDTVMLPDKGGGISLLIILSSSEA